MSEQLFPGFSPIIVDDKGTFANMAQVTKLSPCQGKEHSHVTLHMAGGEKIDVDCRLIGSQIAGAQIQALMKSMDQHRQRRGGEFTHRPEDIFTWGADDGEQEEMQAGSRRGNMRAHAG